MKARQCFASEPGDSRDFGFALALSDSYLAVGDPEANRVVLYSKANGRWSRTGEILPPEGSAAAKVGEGFGYDLDLDGSLLVIGAYTERINQLGVSYSGGVYKVLLDSPAKVERIDATDTGEISGFSVAADDGLIAFVIGASPPGYWNSRVELWDSGEVEQITPPTDTGISDLDMNNDLLLVGTLSEDAAAWLFDLSSPNMPPQKLAAPEYKYIGSVVAISDRFIAVGSLEDPPRTTLIMALKDGSTVLLDGFGYLSLAGNLLARAYPTTEDHEQQARLEIFDLTNLSNPRLIDKRWGISRAQLKDNLLVTTRKTHSGMQICVEQRT